ncbi:hypothetical protein HFD88_006206 [Aspergillus terreus]|nr:hypothetical protein HFD88_006206 [Aspergillus terreus]
MDLFYKPSSDVSLHARISDNPNTQSKPLLVFLHYWGGSSSTWHKLTSPTSPTSLASSYPILAVDVRGWGKSTGPATEDGSAYSISAMAADTASLLEHLSHDENRSHLLAHGFVLVGHSMGAKVALGAVASLPAGLRQQLQGLVLVAPAPPGALDLPAEMKEQQKAAYASDESVRWTVENVLASPANLENEDMRLVVRDSLSGSQLAKEAWPTYGMREDISGSVREALASMGSAGLRVRIIVGELDVVEPKERVDAEVRCFLEECGIPVVLRVAAGVKHLVPLECPEVIHQEVSIF